MECQFSNFLDACSSHKTCGMNDYPRSSSVKSSKKTLCSDYFFIIPPYQLPPFTSIIVSSLLSLAFIYFFFPFLLISFHSSYSICLSTPSPLRSLHRNIIVTTSPQSYPDLIGFAFFSSFVSPFPNPTFFSTQTISFFPSLFYPAPVLLSLYYSVLSSLCSY